MRHAKMLTIVLVIILLGLESLGIKPVLAAAPNNPPIPLSPQGDIYLCESILRNINFKWTSVSGATGYTMQVAVVADFSSILISYSSSSTEVYLGGINLSPGLYYWRVQAYNSDGISGWSSPLSFHVIPSAPVLVSPGANAFVLPNPTFIWTTCYPFDTQFQLSNKPDFSSVLVDVTLNANQYTYKGPYVYEYKFYWPLSSGMYWWRARTKLGTEMSPWVSQLFVVIIPPSIAPVITAPTMNSVLSSLSVNLQWSYVENGDRYQLQIYKDNNVSIDTVVSTNSYIFFGEDNANYSFRVRAGNPVGWGPWSEWRKFKILLPPSTPYLISPYNGIIIQNTNSVVLTWNPISTASSYLVQINSQIFETSNNTLNFVGQWGNTYTWKVKAKNISGESSWSSFWAFTIQENIPPKIEIDSYPQYTNQSNITITGRVYDLESGINELYCGLNLVPILSNGSFRFNCTLEDGLNAFTLIAFDKAGNKSQKTITIVKDIIPPEINITFPIAPLYPNEEVITVISNIKIIGKINDHLPIKLLINNENISVDSLGNFVYQTNLNYGLNKIYLKAIDAAGNISEKVLLIYKTFNQKFIFKINDPQIYVQIIDKNGKLTWDIQEIDPGRYTIPVIVKGRVFIPIRKFIELINGTVEWDAVSQKVAISVPSRGKTIELWIGKPVARITDFYGNQQWVQIEKGDNTIVPFIRNGRSYFPLRFIVEQLNAKVEWDQVLQQVTIEFPIVP